MAVSDSGARGLGAGFETYLRLVVSLSKTLHSQKELVITRNRWLCLDMTEKLLTGALNINTNEETIMTSRPKIHVSSLLFFSPYSRRYNMVICPSYTHVLLEDYLQVC